MTKGFHSPNYTQAPNDWFDAMVPTMGMAELKVTAVLIRNTFGFHRHHVELGLARLAKLTGLSENAVLAGAAEAEERGIIKRANRGKRGGIRTVWEVVIGTSASEVVSDQTTSASEVVPPQPVRCTTSASEVRERNTKEKRKKLLITTASLLSSGTAAAAVDNGWWKLERLIGSSKLPKARREQIEQANPSAGAFVSKYLYALAHAGFHKPALWAASQVSENPGAWEGEPFESLAGLGPSGLAHVLGWLRDDAAYPLSVNGASGAALALRAQLTARHSKEPARMYAAIDDAISDLGLHAPFAPALEQFEPQAVAEVEEPDAWAAVVARLGPELAGPARDRLSRCHLVSGQHGRLIVGVPTRQEFDWLNRMAPMLSARFAVTLQQEAA